MTTRLDGKTLKRELRIRGETYIVALSPLALKLTLKGKRKGLELKWEELVSGDAALAAALNASLGSLTADSVGGKDSDPSVGQGPSAHPRCSPTGASGRKRLG